MQNLKSFDCDLHIHSPYAGGVSKNMLIPILAEQARLKGLKLLNTGDILCKEWIKHAEHSLIKKNHCFLAEGFDTYFILGGEINDINNVHHLFFLEDFDKVNQLRDSLSQYGRLDGKGFGRPTLKISGEKLAEKIVELNGLIGPSHAFTPYFSVYSHFNSVKECYGKMANEIKFIELGLSADSYFADLIQENHNYEFLTCSDSHSPWPVRLGREFIRAKMEKPNFAELKKVLRREDGRHIAMNVGVDPREGKYHCTACEGCQEKYSLKDAISLNWKCKSCKGPIKKGVIDRILELANFGEEIHPETRPPYLHSIPLAELISIAKDVKQTNSKKVQGLWMQLVEKFKSEINILVDSPIEQIAEIDGEIAKNILAFRNGYVLYIAGGGGNYGKPIICKDKEDFEKTKIAMKGILDCNSSKEKQKTLAEFG